MRNSSIVIGIILSILFFIAGYITYTDFFEWTLPVVDNVHYLVTALNEHFRHAIVYSIAVGFIPTTITLTWNIGGIVSIRKRFFSALSIIVCICFAGFTRYLMILNLAKKSGEPGTEYQYGIPLSKVNIETYVLIGLFIGAIIAFLLFRQGKNKASELSF